MVHQARVAWRRFKSGLRLFKPVLPPNLLPGWAADGQQPDVGCAVMHPAAGYFPYGSTVPLAVVTFWCE